MTVAVLPSRANDCPSSHPMLPPPRMTSRSGLSARSHTESPVSGSASASSGIGGTAGSEPVAISACRNRTQTAPISAESGRTNRAVTDAYPNPRGPQRLRRVDWLDRRDRAPHVRHHLVEGHPYSRDVHPEPGAPSGVHHCRGCRDQGLARHTSGPQAIPARPVTLHHQHRRSERGRRPRPDQARGAAADDQQVPHPPLRGNRDGRAAALVRRCSPRHPTTSADGATEVGHRQQEGRRRRILLRVADAVLHVGPHPGRGLGGRPSGVSCPFPKLSPPPRHHRGTGPQGAEPPACAGSGATADPACGAPSLTRSRDDLPVVSRQVGNRSDARIFHGQGLGF